MCPTGQSVCLGCHGPAEKHNMSAFLDRMKRNGVNYSRVQEKLAFYNAFVPVVSNEA